MTPPNRKDALGKGIRSLLQNIDSDLKTTAGTLKTPVVETATGINRIALENIAINPKQPRRDFDEQALKELAASVKLHDIIQPVTVSQLPGGKYQLVTGERRFRLQNLPAYTIYPPTFARPMTSNCWSLPCSKTCSAKT